MSPFETMLEQCRFDKYSHPFSAHYPAVSLVAKLEFGLPIRLAIHQDYEGGHCCGTNYECVAIISAEPSEGFTRSIRTSHLET